MIKKFCKIKYIKNGFIINNYNKHEINLLKFLARKSYGLSNLKEKTSYWGCVSTVVNHCIKRMARKMKSMEKNDPQILGAQTCT